MEISPEAKQLLELIDKQKAFEWCGNFLSKDGFSRPNVFEDDDDDDDDDNYGWSFEEKTIIDGLDAITQYHKEMEAGWAETAKLFLPRIEDSTPVLRWWLGLDKYPQK